MKTISVQTKNPYDILLGRGILQEAGRWIAPLFSGSRAVIITDDVVQKLYADKLRASLEQAGIPSHTFVFPNGESSKNLSTLSELYDFLCKVQITRKDFLIALGGGVVGDLAGFAAATYLRGVDFVQIPTTLLAQVDSSIGGKTGVDIKSGKNLVGAFFQPRLVLCDPDLLATLSDTVFADGLAEVVKYGAAFSGSLFEKLERFSISSILDDVITECIEIKRDVVLADETEQGERMKLNFGHTFGHAIEAYGHYQTHTHGQGVAIGSYQITRLSEAYGLTKAGEAKRLYELLQKYSLPCDLPITKEALVAGSLHDKKRAGDHLTLVLLREVGSCFLLSLSLSDYQNFVMGGYR